MSDIKKIPLFYSEKNRAQALENAIRLADEKRVTVFVRKKRFGTGHSSEKIEYALEPADQVLDKYSKNIIFKAEPLSERIQKKAR